MEKGVIALKAKSDKASLKTMAYQVSQLTTRAVKTNIEIVDCIITFGGVKDVLREVKKLDAQKRFDSLLIYSPNQICKDETEYLAFEKILAEDYKIQIRFVRNNF